VLGAFLQQLNSFFSKYFLIGSFFPVLIFAFVNGMLLYLHVPATEHWLQVFAGVSAATQALWITVLLIALTIAAYVLAGISLPLREFMEGRNWPAVKLFRRLLTDTLDERQTAQYQKQSDAILRIRVIRRDVRKGRAAWQDALGEARRKGNEKQKSPDTDPARSDAARRIHDVTRTVDLEGDVTMKQIREAVADLVSCLTAASADPPAGLNDAQMERWDPHGYASTLSELQDALLRAIDSVERSLDRAFIDRYTQRDACFGPDIVRPTRLGNIAEAMHSYAADRYSLSLDTFWPRFQAVLQADAAFFAMVQETKTQLDFLVSMFWLTAGTLGVWLIALVATGTDPLLFVVVAAAGPALLWWWYSLAETAYATFAEVIRTSVDLFRFKLMEALHVAPPIDIERERALWNALNQIAGYGDRVALRYHHE
jgi:hypothetical protein